MIYKNILWIDDCDDNDSDFDNDFLKNEREGIDDDNNEIVKGYFPKHYESVHLIMKYEDALCELEYCNAQYDLVVFDINLKYGIEKENFSKIRQKLNEKRVWVEDKYEEFVKKAGMYLYLYLLNCGYPNNRMVILTGNGISYPKDFLKSAHIVPIFDRKNKQRFIFEKSGGRIASEDLDWIDSFYSDEYYQVRRLVYKACEYWKEVLSAMQSDKNEIAFNKVYYKDKNDSAIEACAFINMLNRIEMLFPVTVSKDCEAVYYQALQIATMFHEESAKIDVFDKRKNREQYAKIRNYHQAIRNFRNWSAHNQFSSNRIPTKLFSYMFCVTMRSYFLPPESQFMVENGEEKIRKFCDYEKEYFDLLTNKNVDSSSFKRKYRQAFIRHFSKVKNSCDKKCWDCKDINELLLASGRYRTSENTEKMYISDLLLNIIDKWIIVRFDECKYKKCDIDFKNAIPCYVVQYQWEKNLQACDFEKIVSYEADAFKFLAYMLFQQYNDT